MLLRQYKRVRAKQGEDFSYNNIKNVYLIVIYESSPKEFKTYPDIFYHHSKQVFDCGMDLNDDRPESIISLIKKYPEFKAMYETLYLMCQNTERVMGMFSEELRELDKNTVKYMIEEQQREIDIQKEELAQKEEQLNQQTEKLLLKDEQLNQKDEKINQQAEEIAKLKKELERLNRKE